MDREHNWFLFEPEDQFGSKLSADIVEDFISETKLYIFDNDEEEDDYFEIK